MKTLRILLLVLLILVLPTRGAWAGLGHCAGAAEERVAIAAVMHEHTSAHADHGQMASHAHGEVSAELADPGAAPDAGDTCKFCTASCAATPFVSSQPHLSAFTTAASATFPALKAPPPSHLSEGQDRPPQSL